MSDEVQIQGKKFISVPRASDISGYSADHVKSLCDEGKVSNQKIEGSIYVDQMDLMRKRQEDAFGTIRYMEDNTPLIPKPQKGGLGVDVVDGVEFSTKVNEKTFPKEDVDPSLMSDFIVKPSGQKLVALGIALAVVFGVGFTLTSPKVHKEAEYISVEVYKNANIVRDGYVDSLASVISSFDNYQPPALVLNSVSNSSTEENLEVEEISSIEEDLLSTNIDPSKIAPFILLRGENPTIVYVGDKYTDLGATIEDNKDSEVTYTISPGVLDTSSPGERVVTISARDSDGNVSQAERVIIVKEREIGDVNPQNGPILE